jgi:hypothetical protein
MRRKAFWRRWEIVLGSGEQSMVVIRTWSWDKADTLVDELNHIAYIIANNYSR